MGKRPRRATQIRSPKQIALLTAYFCFLASVAHLAFAHPVHATFAEAVWNPKARSIEVALRVRGIDLEEALSKGLKLKVDLEKTKHIDKTIST